VAWQPGSPAEILLDLRVDPGLPGACEVPDDRRNLAWRAAEQFLTRAGLDGRVRLHLVKRIPSGAGLGGGSSDAGAVLRGLLALHPGALTREALAGLALDLGADVPFFLDPRPAWVQGIGEQIVPLPEAPDLAILLLHPGQAVSTAQVYEAWDRSSQRPRSGPYPPDLRELRDASPGALAAACANDLEAPARSLCPAIGELREALDSAGALAVGMSGSGSALYGLFPDRAAADAGAARLASDPARRTWSCATRLAVAGPGRSSGAAPVV